MQRLATRCPPGTDTRTNTAPNSTHSYTGSLKNACTSLNFLAAGHPPSVPVSVGIQCRHSSLKPDNQPLGLHRGPLNDEVQLTMPRMIKAPNATNRLRRVRGRRSGDEIGDGMDGGDFDM